MIIKLFIVGFPREMQEIELVELFSIHGIVNNVTIITDKDTGASKGYGFINMNDEAGADRAIQALDGSSIGDRTINVRIAEDKGQSASGPVNDSTDKEASRPISFEARRNMDHNLPTERKKRPRKRL